MGLHKNTIAKTEPVILWKIDITEVTWALYLCKWGDNERFDFSKSMI